MDSSSARLVAALLSQTPGSEVLESGPGGARVSLALVPLKHMVVIFEAAEHPVQLAEQIKQAVASGTKGVPLHVVVVNPKNLEVDSVIKAQVPAMFLQKTAVIAWSWVPGQAAVAVRNNPFPQVVAAVKLANSDASLSLDEVREHSHRAADEVRTFQQAVMQRKPLVSYGIAVVCVALFALQMFWGDGLPVLAASRMGAEIPTRVLAGEWWRLFSVMLLHANFFHLLMNMLAMLSFGPFLERLMGNGRYLLLFVLSGLGGSLLSLVRGGDGIGVGASGGIWGLMVAGAVVVTWPRGLLPAALAMQLRQRAWVPVGINLVYSLQPGIDMLAHVGGGVTGGLLVLALTRGSTPNELLKPSKLFNAAALAVALVLAGSMGVALVQGKPWELSGPWKLAPVALEGTGLGMSVPAGMDLRRDPANRRWHWGELNSTGAEFIVLVTEPVAKEADFTHALDDMVAELVKPAEGMHYGQKPKKVTLPSGREVVFAELIPDAKDDVRFMWQWWSLEAGRQWVMVLANALNTTSADRKKQLEAVADSVISTGPAPTRKAPPSPHAPAE
jgi:membrane associated rhomboid family serine protease